MNSDFQTPVDIANRALTLCGARRIDTLDDANERASEVRYVYDKLRVNELRRAVWTFAVRKTIVRPIVEGLVLLVTFPTFSSTAVYPRWFPVLDDTGRIYQATTPLAAGDGPDDDTAGSDWVRYFGPDVAFPFDDATTYWAGEMVYDPADGRIFLALKSGTPGALTDPTGDIPDWVSGTVYAKGDTVKQGGLDYQSDVDLNLSTPGVSNWTLVSALTTQAGYRIGQDWLYLGTGTSYETLELPYPIEAGPSTSPSGRGVFRKPIGCVREAPLAPKAGYISPLGASANLPQSDWEADANYIVTMESGPFPYRFVADVSDVSKFDPCFCETLAARIALEVVERLTQSNDKLDVIASKYKKFGGEARTLNAIEAGAIELLEDDYISCRR